MTLRYIHVSYVDDGVGNEPKNRMWSKESLKLEFAYK